MGEARRVYHARADLVRETLHDNDRPEGVVIKTTQDLEAILDGIARDRETMRHGVDKLAARLPLVIAEDLDRRGILNDEDAMRIWLNSSEATPWRIWRGRV